MAIIGNGVGELELFSGYGVSVKSNPSSRPIF